MIDENAKDKIDAASAELLDVLETEIAGFPSIKVLNRKHALRLIAAAFEAVFEAVTNEVMP